MNVLDKNFGRRPDGSKDHTAIARQQLVDEDAAKFEVRVRERARLLAEADRRVAVTDFPTDPIALKAKYDELQARAATLSARKKAIHPRALSAAEDHELTILAQRIHELGKRCRQLGLIERTAA
jgi:hypothetical protein